jgi:5-methyltetrahydrofolate--homocysteine methyltransferase
MLYLCNGIEVVDVGKNAPPERFIQAARANNADLVAVSAMTSVSVPHCERLMSLWAETGLADKTKVIVGGTAVTAELAKALHFDGYAENALGALELALTLMEIV